MADYNIRKMLFLRTSLLLRRSLCQRFISHQRGDAPLDPPEETLILPLYKRNSNEDVKTLKSRLVYQSRKRGMLENGLILSNFATKHLPKMNKTQLELYDRLINTPSNDWDLYYWATGMKNTPMEFDNEVMDLLKEFVRNVDRKSRATQPDL